MKYPNLIYLSEFWVKDLTSTMSVIQEATWIPARPLGYPTFTNRVKCAWLVFTGRADVLIWPKQ